MTPPEGLPSQKTMHKTFGELIGSDGPKLVPLPEEDAKTEGEMLVTGPLHAILRNLTLDVHSRFVIGEEIRKIETALSAARAEEEHYKFIATQSAKTLSQIKEKYGLGERHVMKEMQAELTTLREENRRLREWQPIETAPKDGSVIDLWCDGVRITNCWFSRGEQSWVFLASKGYTPHVYPTHWRPLPAAPESKGGEDD